MRVALQAPAAWNAGNSAFITGSGAALS